VGGNDISKYLFNDRLIGTMANRGVLHKPYFNLSVG
jgi:hypothetical protein